jgi:F-type H+-transporting ATPase subunit b
VTFHKDGKEKEATFDTSKPAEAKELDELLAHGHVEEMKKDEPVNLLAISWDLGLWTVVVFLLLLFILRKVAWNPMLDGLQAREKRIQSALVEAQKAREETQQMRDQVQRDIAQAQEQARSILDEARRDSQAAMEEYRTQEQAKIQAERERLRREIESAKDQILQELWAQTTNLAALIASKTLRRQVAVDDQQRLFDEAVAELPAAVAERQRLLSGGKS